MEILEVNTCYIFSLSTLEHLLFSTFKYLYYYFSLIIKYVLEIMKEIRSYRLDPQYKLNTGINSSSIKCKILNIIMA
jgi:hypothetical protein